MKFQVTIFLPQFSAYIFSMRYKSELLQGYVNDEIGDIPYNNIPICLKKNDRLSISTHIK